MQGFRSNSREALQKKLKQLMVSLAPCPGKKPSNGEAAMATVKVSLAPSPGKKQSIREAADSYSKHPY